MRNLHLRCQPCISDTRMCICNRTLTFPRTRRICNGKLSGFDITVVSNWVVSPELSHPSCLEPELSHPSCLATEALINFKLAPLAVRRRIAILGVLHRCLLQQGPTQLLNFFDRSRNAPGYYRTRASVRSHSNQLVERNAEYQPVLYQRSAFGATRIYNILPQWVALSPSVSAFQKNLQKLVRHRVEAGREDWADTLDWTHSTCGHPFIYDHICRLQHM